MDSSIPLTSLDQGTQVIRAQLKTLPAAPGVYRMVNAKGDVLYVGKARQLKHRVASYTQAERLPHRLQRMVAETAFMEFVVTHTEVEALLLECNLIKKFKPRYNVLLRDDKSFPSLVITADHPFPQLLSHRGARQRKGDYFGPFASVGAIAQTVAVLQRAFMLRGCSNSFFEARTRPCLQYHIKRCTAPCVGRVTVEEYAGQVKAARDFLSGRQSDVQARLAKEMDAASATLDYEKAARLRDRIRALTALQGQQGIMLPGQKDADVIGVHQEAGVTCIQVFFFRRGQNYGNRSYFPRHDPQEDKGTIVDSFLGQFYTEHTPPPLILINELPPNVALLGEALSEKAGHVVHIDTPVRGERKRAVDHAVQNAIHALSRHLAEATAQWKGLNGLKTLFGLEDIPRRVEIYDNSHIRGTHPVGAMVVYGPDGFEKKSYRQFNIRNLDQHTPGDDYAMMREVFRRRFERALEEDPARQSGTWPDLILIDGGKGQLSAALDIMMELGVDDIPLVAVAKGPDRHAGRERFFRKDGEPISLAPNDPVLYLVQRLRDEAHRFAIGTHRARRVKALEANPLDEIPGIGPQRKKALLRHFGSAAAVRQAALADLQAAPGISAATAQAIYDHFHGE